MAHQIYLDQYTLSQILIETHDKAISTIFFLQYRKVSNIRRTKSLNLNASRLIW